MGCNGRRSVAVFGVRTGVLDRRLACGRRHLQHRLPKVVLRALQSGQAAYVLAPVAAHGTTPRGRPLSFSSLPISPITWLNTSTASDGSVDLTATNTTDLA